MAAKPERQMLPQDDLARYGCFAAIATGVVLELLGLRLIFGDDGPGPLRVALIVLGISNAVLGYFALFGSRVAWSFVTATCGTLALICLFGAPKIRDLTGYSLLASATPFFAFTVTTILLSFRRGEN